MLTAVGWVVWSLLAFGSAVVAFQVVRLVASGEIPSSYPEAEAFVQACGARYAVALWTALALLLASLAAGTLVLRVSKLHSIWIVAALLAPRFPFRLHLQYSSWFNDHAQWLFVSAMLWTMGFTWFVLAFLAHPVERFDISVNAPTPLLVLEIVALGCALAGVVLGFILHWRAHKAINAHG